jgi:small subunit ribosomal protein S11
MAQSKNSNVPLANVHISSTMNNTIVTITNTQGDVLPGCQASTGMEGYKGARKSTPYAAQSAAAKVAQIAKDRHRVQEVEIFLCGPGSGRDSASRAIGQYLRIRKVIDVTPIPHNGCRQKKERRN